MSEGEQHDEAPVVTDHAARRWAERMPHAVVDIGTAWTDGITVSASRCDCDGAKLYPPQDALLLRKNHCIVTVLPVDYTRLDAVDLVWCVNCGCATKLQRSLARCEWCASRTGTERSDGNIQIRC